MTYKEIIETKLLTKFIGIELGESINSPLREEANPSFSLFWADRSEPARELYMDFGDGRCGDIIRFVMNLRECTQAEAFLILEKWDGETPQIVVEANHKRYIRPEDNCDAARTLPLPMGPVSESFYLQQNKLTWPDWSPEDFAYSDKNRNLVFKTVHGLHSKGRNPEPGTKRWQSFVGPCSYTVLGRNLTKAVVFEGVGDFLSFLELFPTAKQDSYTYVILNTAHQAKNGELSQYLTAFEQVFLILDLDVAGDSATKTIQSYVPQAVDKRKELITYGKDLRDTLDKKRNIDIHQHVNAKMKHHEVMYWLSRSSKEPSLEQIVKLVEIAEIDKSKFMASYKGEIPESEYPTIIRELRELITKKAIEWLNSDS